MDRTAKTRQRGVKGFLYWWLESRYNPKIIYVDILLLFIISVSVFFTLLERTGKNRVERRRVVVMSVLASRRLFKTYIQS